MTLCGAAAVTPTLLDRVVPWLIGTAVGHACPARRLVA
jgi:hypothetical protein